MPIGRATIMQIRGQYLIQDNHDDYTSQSAFSRGRGNVMCAHTYTHAHAIPSPHHDRSSSFFPPPLRVPFHPLTASKCLGSPPGGVSWQKCIAAYHTICSRCNWKEKERERIYLPLPTRRLESISLGRRKNKKRNLSPFPLLFLSSKRKIFGSRTERAFKETFEFISNFFSPSKPEQNRCAPHFLHVLTPSGGA